MAYVLFCSGYVLDTDGSCTCDDDPNDDCFPLFFDDNIDRGFDDNDCFPFVRSLRVRDESCSADGPYEQINSITSFVDISQLYGSEDDLASRLRDTDTTRGGFCPIIPH